MTGSTLGEMFIGKKNWTSVTYQPFLFMKSDKKNGHLVIMGMSDVGNQHHVSGGQISLLFAMDMAKVAGPYVVFHQFCRLLT